MLERGKECLKDLGVVGRGGRLHNRSRSGKVLGSTERFQYLDTFVGKAFAFLGGKAFVAGSTLARRTLSLLHDGFLLAGKVSWVAAATSREGERTWFGADAALALFVLRHVVNNNAQRARASATRTVASPNVGKESWCVTSKAMGGHRFIFS